MKIHRALLPLSAAIFLMGTSAISHTDRAAFMSRCHEGLGRIEGNLNANSSSRNDSAIRAYYINSTLAMFDSTLLSDSLRAVVIKSECGADRTMGINDFLAYINGRDDSVAQIISIEVPAYPSEGFVVDSLLSPVGSPVAVMTTCDSLIADVDSARTLFTNWDATIYGPVPVPTYGCMTVRILPVSPTSTLATKVDTIGRHTFPVFFHVL